MSKQNLTNINILNRNQAVDVENYSVQELNDDELENITGGFIGGFGSKVCAYGGGAIGAIVGAAGDAVGADTNAKEGAKIGYYIGDKVGDFIF